MLSAFITNANTLSTTFIPFFHLCCWTYRLKSYKGRKICQFKLVHCSKSVPVHTVSAPSCSIYFHLFGPLKSCVSVLLSGIVHIHCRVFLWILLIGCLNISPQFMSIKFRVRAGSVRTAKHSCKSNESTWTTRESKENSSIRRTGREGRRLWWGTWPSFFFHHVTAPPVMSEVRGIFFKTAVNIAHVSSLQCKSMVRMLCLIVWLCVWITCIIQASCRTRRRPGTQPSSFVRNRGAKAMKTSKRI